MVSKRSGITLLELMIVVLIIAGVVGISWPAIMRKSKSADKIILEQQISEAVENQKYLCGLNNKISLIYIEEKKVTVTGLDNIPTGSKMKPTYVIDGSGTLYNIGE